MISYTLKSVVANLKKFATNKEFLLKLKDSNSDTELEFHITKDMVTVTYFIEDDELLHYVDDIEMLSIPEDLTPLVLITKNSQGETSVVEIQIEAQLFVKVFNIMRDRVRFSIESTLGPKECLYFGRKMYYIDEQDSELKLVETNLYKFHKMHGDYSIRTLSPLIGKMDAEYLYSSKEQVAKDLGKEFTLVKA